MANLLNFIFSDDFQKKESKISIGIFFHHFKRDLPLPGSERRKHAQTIKKRQIGYLGVKILDNFKIFLQLIRNFPESK